MFEPLSSTIGIAWLGYAGIAAQARRGSGVSSEAIEVSRATTLVVESAERSDVLFGAKAEALSKLLSHAREHSLSDWDGAGAEPVSPAAVSTAAEFVRALPDAIPIPEFAVEPDGAMSLDWFDSKTRLFSVSCGNSSRLAYAWLDGADRGHGVADFSGSVVPSRLLEGIRSIVGHGRSVAA